MFQKKSLLSAFRFSLNGLVYTFRREQSFKQEIILFFFLSPCAFYFSESLIEFILLIGVVCLVLVLELVNTSIELTIDRIGLEFSELSGLAKDVASAAVFLALIFAVFVWTAIICDNYFLFFKT